MARPPVDEVERLARAPRRPGRRGRAVCASGSHAEQRAGSWARRRRGGPTRGTTPSARTPGPASTNGARACTTPSEPCSPRCPPWSSQLWSAEWSTHRSGAAGWSNSWATCSYAYGYELSRRCGLRFGLLGGERREAVGGLVGERVGALGAASKATVEARAVAAEPDRSRRATPPRSASSRASSTMSTIGSSAGSVSTSRARSASARAVVTQPGHRLWGHGACDSRPPAYAATEAARLSGEWAESLPLTSALGARSHCPTPFRHLLSSPAEDPRADLPPQARRHRARLARHRRRGRRARSRSRPRSPRSCSGKHKPIYAPHVDTGDHVIVVNAAKLDVSARKLADKQYYRHSGYPGGLRTESLEHLLARDPERVIRLAVQGMLPKSPLGRADDQEAARLRRRRPTRTPPSSPAACPHRDAARRPAVADRSSSCPSPSSRPPVAARRPSHASACAPARGVIIVNGRPFEQYFPILTHRRRRDRAAAPHARPPTSTTSTPRSTVAA